jgi:4a-hydroxytetrahydrobiopterin dehydratase
MKLSADEITTRLADHPGWSLEANALQKTYKLDTFADAIAFVTRLAFDAEAADHHPDLHVSYRTVGVTWSTHSAGGVTAKDFVGARQSDMIAARLRPR